MSKGATGCTTLRNDFINFTDVVSLRYTDDNGTPYSGIITIELGFSPSTFVLQYHDIKYSDPKTEKEVEGNPNVLRSIDSYIRNKILKTEYRF